MDKLETKNHLAALALRVKEDQKSLKVHNKVRATTLKNLRKDETRVTYLKDYDAYEVLGDRLSKACELLLAIKTPWNHYKMIMDLSCGQNGAEENKKEFQKAYSELYKLFGKRGELNELAKLVKGTKHCLDIDKHLKQDLRKQVDFMTRVRDNARKLAKSMDRTKNQREGDASRSASMSARWGSF